MSRTQDEIWKLELTELGELIRTRQLTSEGVTQSTLERIAALDPELKSYAWVMRESALAAARAADAEIAAGHYRSVLHGVPIGVKDLCYTVDAPTAAGTTILAGFRPEYDATVVARLRAAGAVITGKLTMTEGAYLAYHPSVTAPINPWDSQTWAGVSSSGCGVATAAGLCFGSIGSDTGGSIRFPASMCGLTGIKPTWGRVSRYGIVELAASFDHVGPLARSARDAAALLTAIAGPDPNDPSSAVGDQAEDYCAELTLAQKPRVGVDPSLLATFDEDTNSMMVDVIGTLTKLGWSVTDVAVPALDPIMDAFGKLRAAETARAHARTYPARAHEYGPVLGALIAAGRKLTTAERRALIEQRQDFAEALRRVFQCVDILLMPSAGLASPTLDTMRRLGQDTRLNATLATPTAPFNVSGHPAMCLPAGFTTRGTPLGVQFIGREFSERFLIQSGHAFQQVTTFHRRRPPLARSDRS
ncbi:MAG: amidase [Actinomycetia bacterium]|nr:amidase [Actinomycetes bacterium]MCH9700891.1 amidase [Actinomycetes bacterium]MCH9760847.1 amidase [Actinomycetes bacterium]